MKHLRESIEINKKLIQNLISKSNNSLDPKQILNYLLNNYLTQTTGYVVTIYLYFNPSLAKNSALTQQLCDKLITADASIKLDDTINDYLIELASQSDTAPLSDLPKFHSLLIAYFYYFREHYAFDLKNNQQFRKQIIVPCLIYETSIRNKRAGILLDSLDSSTFPEDSYRALSKLSLSDEQIRTILDWLLFNIFDESFEIRQKSWQILKLFKFPEELLLDFIEKLASENKEDPEVIIVKQAACLSLILHPQAHPLFNRVTQQLSQFADEVSEEALAYLIPANPRTTVSTNPPVITDQAPLIDNSISNSNTQLKCAAGTEITKTIFHLIDTEEKLTSTLQKKSSYREARLKTNTKNLDQDILKYSLQAEDQQTTIQDLKWAAKVTELSTSTHLFFKNCGGLPQDIQKIIIDLSGLDKESAIPIFQSPKK